MRYMVYRMETLFHTFEKDSMAFCGVVLQGTMLVQYSIHEMRMPPPSLPKKTFFWKRLVVLNTEIGYMSMAFLDS